MIDEECSGQDRDSYISKRPNRKTLRLRLTS
jgi:hypothetical protein